MYDRNDFVSRNRGIPGAVSCQKIRAGFLTSDWSNLMDFCRLPYFRQVDSIRVDAKHKFFSANPIRFRNISRGILIESLLEQYLIFSRDRLRRVMHF